MEDSKKIVFNKDLITKCAECFSFPFPPFKCENKNCNKMHVFNDEIAKSIVLFREFLSFCVSTWWHFL